MPRVCIFDVNETLLDLAALDPHFERIFGDAAARQAWFSLGNITVEPLSSSKRRQKESRALIQRAA